MFGFDFAWLRRINLAIAVMAVLLVLTYGFSAVAQVAAAAAAPTTYAVDLKPVLDSIVALLAALLTGLGSWAVTRFSTWLKLQNDSAVRAVLTTGVTTAVNYAITKLQASEGQLATVKTQNAAVAEATSFLVAHFPDAIKYFGIDSAGLARMILARLPAPADPAPGSAAPAAPAA